jgi:hypothetical protein
LLVALASFVFRAKVAPDLNFALPARLLLLKPCLMTSKLEPSSFALNVLKGYDLESKKKTVSC